MNRWGQPPAPPLSDPLPASADGAPTPTLFPGQTSRELSESLARRVPEPGDDPLDVAAPQRDKDFADWRRLVGVPGGSRRRGAHGDAGEEETHYPEPGPEQKLSAGFRASQEAGTFAYRDAIVRAAVPVLDRDEADRDGEGEQRPLRAGRERSAAVNPRAGGANSEAWEPDSEDDEPVLLEGGPRVIALPSSLRDAVAVPAVRAVVGTALIAAVVVLVLLGRWWASNRAADTQEITTGAAAHSPVEGDTAVVSAGVSGPLNELPGQSDAAASGAPGAGGGIVPGSNVAEPQAPGGAAPPAENISVHVAGAVATPGVVEVPSGARVLDAIEAAGGFAKKAEPATVNLAREAVDGEQVVVAFQGEAPVAAAPAAGAAPGKAPAAGEPGAKVNLNTADQATLETLPGVGPVMAGRIIEWRKQNGGFTRVDDLNAVSGVGEKTFARLAPLVTV